MPRKSHLGGRKSPPLTHRKIQMRSSILVACWGFGFHSYEAYLSPVPTFLL
jgi:hypothetical protein